MSRKKFDSGLLFFPIVPNMMKIVGLRRKKELAKFLEISPQSLQAYKPGTRNRIVPSDWVVKFLMKTNSSLGHLLEGKREEELKLMSATRANMEKPENEENQEEVGRWVSELWIPWAVKDFAAVEEKMIGVSLEVVEDWIEHYFSASKGHLAVWIMDSDNMEPTIRRNSLVLIDRRIDRVKGAGMYALMANYRLFVRTVSVRLDGTLNVTNDNPKYENGNKSLKDKYCEENDGLGKAKVVGRVVFVGNPV